MTHYLFLNFRYFVWKRHCISIQQIITISGIFRIKVQSDNLTFLLRALLFFGQKCTESAAVHRKYTEFSVLNPPFCLSEKEALRLQTIPAVEKIARRLLAILPSRNFLRSSGLFTYVPYVAAQISCDNIQPRLEEKHLGICDFHVHSTASDGRLTPVELVNEAALCGLEGFAIADHDTLAAVEMAFRRSKELGLFYIPAVELSVDLHSGGSAHLLGYFPLSDPSSLCDPTSEIQMALKFVVQARNTRNPAIIDRLRKLGFDVSMEEVLKEAGEAVVGRPHIAAVMVKKGLAGSSLEVFDRYLGTGKPAYVERSRLGDYRAIEIIRQAGGLPVLAHPAYIPTDGSRGLQALISSLADAGLAGLEAYYPEHDKAIISFLSGVAKKYKLLLTGGSDFHGIKHPRPGWNDGSSGVDSEKVMDFINKCSMRGSATNGYTQ
jgi:predicted metal-dependent phosphoesterase TrpH